MSSIQDTAYPRFKSSLSPKELNTAYSISPDDLAFSRQFKTVTHQFFALLQLKAYQKLGYVARCADIPEELSRHVAVALGLKRIPGKAAIRDYERSTSIKRHARLIRDHLGVRLLKQRDYDWLASEAEKASVHKEFIVDIINVLLEHLVKQRYEIPGFTVLDKIANAARVKINDQVFQHITRHLSGAGRRLIDAMLDGSGHPTFHSTWHKLKREPRRPTTREIHSYLQHLAWLKEFAEQLPRIDNVPLLKYKQLVNEARALDLGKVNRLKPSKRYALIVAFTRHQYASALDDAADLLIRMMHQIENTANESLQKYQLMHMERADRLIENLKGILETLGDDSQSPQGSDQSVKRFIGSKREALLEDCAEHLAYAGNNYLPFMLRPFRSKRSSLYNCLTILDLKSTSSDTLTLQLIRLIEQLRYSKTDLISLDTHVDPGLAAEIRRGKWMLNKWEKLVFVDGDHTIHRKYFELAVLTLVKQELKSGDLCVENGDKFDDYRDELVTWEHFDEELAQYCEEVEIPTEPKALVKGLKQELIDLSRQVDAAFPENSEVRIEHGRLSIKRLRAKALPENMQAIDEEITSRLGKKSIIDALVDTEQWLNLHADFGPLSGFKGKLNEPKERFIASLFCYGCNLGASQTADSIKQLNRKQIAWLNLNSVTVDRLDAAIVKVINAYKKYDLPGYWGSGERASADGTKWNIYEQNLLSEYHIRYGGYGGIGYYHVSDTYIALFSHFIPCGVREAVYILDGILNNKSDIQPNTVHGDTHAQSYPVFGLSYLLGIQLMPRIKNIGDLKFYRPDNRMKYGHIDNLFHGSIDWRQIEKHLPDMLRVAISIKLGKISPSTILRRLGTHSRKNKLYFAFRELGKVIRTIFLLKYIQDPELRRTISAATNKNEQFNDFAKWSFFGNNSVIESNVTIEQQKIVKYNHLVANMLILHNVEMLTRVLSEMSREGIPITEEVIRATSPYRRSHLRRYGDYHLDFTRRVMRQLHSLALNELTANTSEQANIH